MNNEEIVKNICQNIVDEAGKIVGISNNIKMYIENGHLELAKDFDDIRVNELEQMQKLTLMLTSCIMQNSLLYTEKYVGQSVQNDEAIFGNEELMAVKKVEDENDCTEVD